MADAAERLRAANVATPDGGTAATDAPATDADAPTIAAREPGADVHRASTPERTAHAARQAADDAMPDDDAASADGFDLDMPEATAPRADAPVAAQAKAESPTSVSSLRPEAPTEAAPDPADLPDVAPRDVGNGPVRVAIDDDLALEVVADDNGIDVTLEGDDEAVRPLTDVGPELEEELARHGWDLRQFGSRRDGQAETTQHHVGTAIADEETPSDTPANRVRPRGKLVDTLA